MAPIGHVSSRRDRPQSLVSVPQVLPWRPSRCRGAWQRWTTGRCARPPCHSTLRARFCWLQALSAALRS